MTQGALCNRRPVNTEEELKAVLADKGGQLYYKELEELDVDTNLLWETVKKDL